MVKIKNGTKTCDTCDGWGEVCGKCPELLNRLREAVGLLERLDGTRGTPGYECSVPQSRKTCWDNRDRKDWCVYCHVRAFLDGEKGE